MRFNFPFSSSSRLPLHIAHGQAAVLGFPVVVSRLADTVLPPQLGCDILTDVRDALIARTISTLGRDLNLSVVAEGVETEGQRRFVEKLGCDAFQGYLASPALPARKFEEFVAVPVSEATEFDRVARPLVA